jgi:hypothetical protein
VNRMFACMFGLVGIAAAVLVLSLSAPKASAAPAYCGHGWKTYVKTLPAGAVVFRISYAWGSTGSQHVHHYRIFRRQDLGYTVKWVYVTSIDRVCLNTHPV